jgi:hypothetical protein
MGSIQVNMIKLLPPFSHNSTSSSANPSLNDFRELQVQEKSHTWWYPSSVFCSLSLRAMGPIPLDDGGEYFLDLYICSYTPSIYPLIIP